MATAIMNMSGFPLEYPNHGRLQIRTITRAMMPAAGSWVPSATLGDNCFEFYFNPLIHLTSLQTAFSFFFGKLAAMDSRVGTEVVYPIATFAFDLVRRRNWFYGLSLSVVLETTVVEQPPRSLRWSHDDFLDGHMILNDDTAVPDYYYYEEEELDDSYAELDYFLFDLMIQPSASTGVDHGNNEAEDDTVVVGGMSDQEISMLKTERLLGDDEEEGECCSICLEGFMRGMVVTQLPSCSHRFHNGCIVQWLHNNPTCPICRRRCMVRVS